MSSRVQDLIERHFAGLLSPAEQAELAELVTNDPSAADLFASAGRLESSLRSHFQEAARIRGASTALGNMREQFAARSPSRRRWAGLALAAAILVVVWSLWESPLPTDPRGDSTVVKGQVVVEGKDSPRPRHGELVRAVGPDEAILRMSDGSIAAIEPDTQMIVFGEVGEIRQVVELVEGSGKFRVEPGGEQFQVETRVGRVTSLDGEFRVRLTPRKNAEDRVFPGTDVAGLGVMATSGVVQVQIDGKIHTLVAGQDQIFVPDREARRGLRETVAILSAIQPTSVSVFHGEGRRREVVHPLAEDVAVTIDGQPATLSRLKPGMTVYLQRFADEDDVIAVRAEGPSLAGILRRFDARSRTATIEFRGGRESGRNEQTYPLAAEARILIDGRLASSDDLPVGGAVTVKLSVDRRTVVELSTPRRREGENRRP